MTGTWSELTRAERRVLPLVADGLRYREVATALHLSRRTVESHVASMCRKLGVRTRGELARAYWVARHEQPVRGTGCPSCGRPAGAVAS